MGWEIFGHSESILNHRWSEVWIMCWDATMLFGWRPTAPHGEHQRVSVNYCGRVSLIDLAFFRMPRSPFHTRQSTYESMIDGSVCLQPWANGPPCLVLLHCVYLGPITNSLTRRLGMSSSPSCSSLFSPKRYARLLRTPNPHRHSIWQLAWVLFPICRIV